MKLGSFAFSGVVFELIENPDAIFGQQDLVM